MIVPLKMRGLKFMNKSIKFSKKDNSIHNIRYGRYGYHIENVNIIDVVLDNPMIIHNFDGYYITCYDIVINGRTYSGKGRLFYKLNEAKDYVRSDDFIKEILEHKEEIIENIRKDKEKDEKHDEYIRTFYENVLENCKGFGKSNEYNVGDEVEVFSQRMKYISLDDMFENLRHYDDERFSTKTRSETIFEIVEISNEAFDEWLGKDLYNDNGSIFNWENKGDKFIGGVTMVKSPNRPNVFIDSQGYHYARYVYLEVDNFQEILDFRKENYIEF